MPAYTIVYKSENDEPILKETVFMKNLGATTYTLPMQNTSLFSIHAPVGGATQCHRV